MGASFFGGKPRVVGSKRRNNLFGGHHFERLPDMNHNLNILLVWSYLESQNWAMTPFLEVTLIISLVHFAWLFGLSLFANEWVFRTKPLKVSHF